MKETMGEEKIRLLNDITVHYRSFTWETKTKEICSFL